MLARGAAPRPAVDAPPPSEGPSVDDLTIGEADFRDAGARLLIALVNRAQQLRVGARTQAPQPSRLRRGPMPTTRVRVPCAAAVFGHFDDAFERLVTVGDADGYPACVERFKPKFGALDGNLERCAMRLDALQQAPVGTIVRGIIRDERARFDAKCDEQVLRQRLSLTDLGSEERADLKAKVQAKKKPKTKAS